VSEITEGDFVYLDPPYIVNERRVFADYLARSATFSAKDLDRLKISLEKIDASGAKFLLSYADSPEARRLAKAWRHRKVSSQRNIAGFVGARKIASELLVTNIPR
jgi:site-specific DNA-adenine methylase